MPMYEYRCNACKREFEYEQRMSDDDLVTCEACGEDKLEKLISRTAFQLKGSGWYKDLYSSPSAKPAETKSASEPAAAKPDAPSSSSSSDSSSSSSTPAASTPAPSSSGGSKD